MERKYKDDDVVVERIHPALKLVVSKYSDRIYNCKATENPVGRELVYFERELMADATR